MFRCRENGSARIAAILGLCGCLFLAILPRIANAAAIYTDFQLRSDSAGTGTLAVRVYYPPTPSQFRYGASIGAPVVVYLLGGFNGGHLLLFQPDDFTAQGLIVLSFIYPGSSDPTPASSGGTYDDRGDACQRAVRDVLNFGSGTTTDTLGRTLSQICGGAARGDLLGMLGDSNGGTIAVTTLSRYGSGCPTVAYLVMRETPSNSQYFGLEFGQKSYDPNSSVDADGDGIARNDVYDGAYTVYGYPTATVDYTKLRYSSTTQVTYPTGFSTTTYTGMFYMDMNGNGVYDFVSGNPLNSDVNGNGIIDATEDYPMPGLAIANNPSVSGPFYGMLSTGAANYALANSLASPWPTHYFTSAQVSAYFSIRDPIALGPQAMANMPNLRAMSCFMREDHVLSDKEHTHVHQFLDLFQNAGHWFRLNPDKAYVDAVVGSSQTVTDNNANISVTASQMDGCAEPTTAPSYQSIEVAGLCEMADRTRAGDWSANLPATLVTVGAPVVISRFGIE